MAGLVELARRERPVWRLPGWALGIRARLFVLTLVTLTPLVAALVWQDYTHLTAARQRADAEASRLALLKAGDLDHHLQAIETQIVALRALVAADPAAELANAAALGAVVEELPTYIGGIAAHTPAGAPLGSAWRAPLGGEIPDAALRDQIADAEIGAGLVVGQPLAATPARPALVLASRALAGQDGRTAVLTLAVQPDRMPFLTDARGLPVGSTVWVVDVRGPLLARSSPTETTGAAATVSGAAAPGAAPAALPPPGGTLARDRVAGHAVATRAPWIVYVEAPAEVALVAARDDFRQGLMLGSVTLGLALLLAWLISERISAPIRRLTADAAALGAGQLARRTAVQSSTEIGVLATVFNETAGAIERLVTDLRRTQTEVRELNAHLEARVRDRTAQLAALNAELEAFSFAVSHDLRAPLRRVRGFGEALREDYGNRLDDDGRLLLERLEGCAEQMGQLIDDLLRLSRVSQAELIYGPVDLSRLAAEVAAELRQLDPGHPVTLTIAAGLTAEGDANLLRVVLQNLLANAWKFTRGRSDPYVQVGAALHDGAPAFYVRDNGVGFDPAHAQKLFRAFQRLHDARDFEGTGIGLATVQRIVHRHGGRVWADGSVGGGATFWFTLPAWPERG